MTGFGRWEKNWTDCLPPMLLCFVDPVSLPSSAFVPLNQTFCLTIEVDILTEVIIEVVMVEDTAVIIKSKPGVVSLF